MILHTFMAQLVAVLMLAGQILALKAEVIHRRQEPDIPQGYALGHLHVTGNLNGVAINHTGTIQDVFEQLDAEHNSFKLSDLATIKRRDPFLDQHHKASNEARLAPISLQLLLSFLSFTG